MPVLFLPCCSGDALWIDVNIPQSTMILSQQSKQNTLLNTTSLSLSTNLISFLQCLTDSDVNSRHPFFKILFLSLNSVNYVCPIFLALYSLELLIQHSVSLVDPSELSVLLVLFCSRLPCFIHQSITLAHESFKRRKCASFHLSHYLRTRMQ